MAYAVTADAPSGLNVEVGNKKFSASHDTVVSILSTLERMWSRALDWSHDNPIQFSLIILLLMFAIVQKRKGRVEQEALKISYDRQRAEVRDRQQQPLPFPKKPDHDRENGR